MTEPAIAAFQPKTVPLRAWSRGQALAMAAALVVCAWRPAAWPVAPFALLSFLWLLRLARGAFTPSAAFGLANSVTALRLLMLLALASYSTDLGGSQVLAIVALILLLDGVDG